jgi:hypothetical protein
MVTVDIRNIHAIFHGYCTYLRNSMNIYDTVNKKDIYMVMITVNISTHTHMHIVTVHMKRHSNVFMV